jgi:hypothetical protein
MCAQYIANPFKGCHPTDCIENVECGNSMRSSSRKSKAINGTEHVTERVADNIKLRLSMFSGLQREALDQAAHVQ